MRAGQLRHRVTLERRVEGFDDVGQPSATWEPVADVWAAVEPLSGSERFAALQTGAVITHRVRMRARECVLPIDRVCHRGRKLYAQGPALDMDERGRELHLMTEERVDE